jgi:hypothetical protein
MIAQSEGELDPDLGQEPTREPGRLTSRDGASPGFAGGPALEERHAKRILMSGR